MRSSLRCRQTGVTDRVGDQIGGEDIIGLDIIGVDTIGGEDMFGRFDIVGGDSQENGRECGGEPEEGGSGVEGAEATEDTAPPTVAGRC